MSLLPLSPAMTLNLFALFAAGPGVWLLSVTRSKEQRENAHLHTLTEQAPIDEPMHLMDVGTLRLIRTCYRVGAGCLGFALLLSWASTHL
ncbi:hypothetical protein ABQX22_02850 [Xanthomonas sp. WHRI 1810A]|uniref:hypothetical protein n=1 Tax=Xanthomonas sp. WHRI 1810A TaxID=3161565 RepID=UPI0032E8E1A5